jgi:transposase InsO family protein
MDCWAYTNQVILDFSRRGKPTDNATTESFNGRFREECLNVHWFASLEDAQHSSPTHRRAALYSSPPTEDLAPSTGLTNRSGTLTEDVSTPQ